jgi:hypothetical protein
MTTNDTMPALFSPEETEKFRDRWASIQTDFVDRPQEVVEQADRLVADLMSRLSSQFSDERARLRAAVGSRRRCLHRGAPRHAHAVSLVLRAPARRVTVTRIASPA